MKLNDHFKQFVANISLNPTRIEKIESAVRNWEKKFKDDDEIKDIFVDYYTQGSYSTDTGVRPKSGEEFDVDVVLVMDIDEEADPKDILHHIKVRIKSHKEFEDRVKVKDRCVRIEYAKEFHVDVVPAFEFDSCIKIPSKKEKEWTKTNPSGFKDWCNDINKESDHYFSQVVKILKHWRDDNVGKDTAPKSILLTTLAGNAFTKKPSIAETLVETLDIMIQDIDDLLFWLSEDDDVPFVRNPSLQDENLARNWTKLKAQRYLNKLKSLKESCKEALDESDKDKSIEKWQDIFGKNYFPSELGEAKAMANTIQKGSAFVSSTGVLNKDSGIPIKDHRFYGTDTK
ncbi:cyclic GMP-AMP synthase DncV-like nucleotidyltransferase [Cytobacillus sp. FSL W8-0315]|uniref:SMODS domain-containing nucleotidyltransferase n=1 Tax=Cytobacillus sp. FSL W8-0315 TaxID=2921600 RepID=UPI0002D38859